MKIVRSVGFIVLTALFILIVRDLSLLLHEWTHSTIAWLYGLKANPLAIHYGGWMLLNVYAVDCGGFYQHLFADSHNMIAGLIAIGGPAMNFVLMFVGFLLVLTKRIKGRPWLAYFLYWFTLMNLGQVFSYIPIRGFSHSGDFAYFERAFHLSPWLFVIPISLILLFILISLLNVQLPKILTNLKIYKSWARRTLLFISIAIVFFWFGVAALFYYGMHDIMSISYPISVVIGLGLFILLARTKRYS